MVMPYVSRIKRMGEKRGGQKHGHSESVRKRRVQTKGAFCSSRPVTIPCMGKKENRTEYCCRSDTQGDKTDKKI